jgi:hypothetical protein
VLVINYLVELPFGQNRRYLNYGGVVDKLVGGWQLGGIHRYQSGVPLSFFTSDPLFTDFLQLTGYLGNLRLNPTGQEFESDGPFIDNRFGQQAINPAAFTPPPQFGSGFNNNPSGAAIGSAGYAAYYADPLRFFGTLAPALSNVRSPRFYSEDVSLLKKTRITETVVFELGAEAFNLFNRTYFFNPTTDLRDAVNFGFHSIGANNPRRIQLRLRLLF